MPRKEGRQYRAMARLAPAEGEGFIVEGYASTFEPYVLFHADGVDYKERIDPHAFDGADMSDVILQYDHQGRVYARTSNGTLTLTVDDHGLMIRADLSLTEGARQLYEEIKCGLITRMSFCFTVADGGDSYDPDTNTDTIMRIAKVFDVSAVSIPANPGTDIAARALDGEIDARWAERLSRQRTLRIARMRMRILTNLVKLEGKA